MINDNSQYIAMHLDRLNEELISDTYGKQSEESQKKCECKCGCTKTINMDHSFCNFCIREHKFQ